MREVKEKPSLKERMDASLKAAPKEAFRRSANASFQQLRQQMREAAQDGYSEDRYESDRITHAADAAARQIEHISEGVLRKLPKTKQGKNERSDRQENTRPDRQREQVNHSDSPIGERPSERMLPREKQRVLPASELSVSQKSITTDSVLPVIKTKEYILQRREKQNLSSEKSRPFEESTEVHETVPSAGQTGKAVRESTEVNETVPSAGQTEKAVRERTEVLLSQPAGEEKKSLPEIKSEEKNLSGQTAARRMPDRPVVQQTDWRMTEKSFSAAETTDENAFHNQKTERPAPAEKPARAHKKEKPERYTIKAPQPKASASVSGQVTPAHKSQVLQESAVKAADSAKEAGKRVLKAITKATEKLMAAIAAGGTAAVCIAVVMLLIGMLFASPLGILFAGEDTGTEITIPDAVAALNGEFTEAIYRIMEEHPYDELDVQPGMETAMLRNWRNVLAVYAVKVSTDEEHGLEVMTMDEEKLRLLRDVFFDANKLEYRTTVRVVEDQRITTLHISAQIKDASQMANEYGFPAQQREMLEELLKPEYDDVFLSLIGDYRPDGTPIGPVDISDIQGTLRDDLDAMREDVVLTAYQLLGKVTYFWGGKSLVLGWDSRWGTPTTVTAPGSGSTGKTLPFGLDCSGFVDWTFYNATGGAYLPGRGGGAASQHGYCTNITWAEAQPGDLVFYYDDSHVGIVCGFDSAGDPLIIHCSGGQNGVVVTGRENFSVAARPDLFAD